MKKILEAVSQYYTNKVATNGPTPNGVDWNGQESQELRFSQLCKILPVKRSFSINDIGCGYGALISYIEKSGRSEQMSIYNGIDISAEMINQASSLYPKNDKIQFNLSQEPVHVFDYSIASGIFNVKMAFDDDDWRKYFFKTLHMMDKYSTKGFSFNCLTSYSDKEKMRGDLFYPNPMEVFDYCKLNFAKNVALLHDYGLYEFTILVRKNIEE